MPISRDGESCSTTPGVTGYNLDSETAPLLSSSSPKLQYQTRHHRPSALINNLTDPALREHPRLPPEQRPSFHSSHESCGFHIAMAKLKSTRLATYVDKLAVESEPGLTNAQLMLNNHDLKPGQFASLRSMQHS